MLKPDEFGPVRTLSELRSIVRRLSKQYRNHLMLFRGQQRLHEHIRSGRARPNSRIPRDVEIGWRSLALQMLGRHGKRLSYAYAGAILQHYGLATHFVDLTANLEVAAWFATRKYSRRIQLYAGHALREFEHVSYELSDEEFGYVLILAIPDPKSLQKAERLFDLSYLPPVFIRPHKQNGWLMLDRPPTEPSPNNFWVATVRVKCKAFEESFKTSEMFPPPSIDPAFASLLALPFVQVPAAYYEDRKSKPSPKVRRSFHRAIDEMCLASRALAIPEYADDSSSECTNHKWSDITIYEPHHVRMWKRWRFDLGSVYPGVTGDIKDAVKITLSPSAREMLFSTPSRKCYWPELGSDSLFFSFAALDHDKVIDHAPPYYGVWLHRDDELIIETPTVANDTSLMVTAGHAYFLRDGVLKRQAMRGTCKCGKPKTHDRRVRAVLQLSALLQGGQLLVLPHPRMAPLGWYVVITTSDALLLQEPISKARKIISAINRNIQDAR